METLTNAPETPASGDLAQAAAQAPAKPITPLDRARKVMEGVRMARANARQSRLRGDEAAARASFRNAYWYIDIARMFRRMA